MVRNKLTAKSRRTKFQFSVAVARIFSSVLPSTYVHIHAYAGECQHAKAFDGNQDNTDHTSLRMCCAHTDRRISNLKEKQIFTQCDDLKNLSMYIICIPVQSMKTLRMALLCNSFVYLFVSVYASCIHQVCLTFIALFEENSHKAKKDSWPDNPGRI